jgi:hypothetical protein
MILLLVYCLRTLMVLILCRYPVYRAFRGRQSKELRITATLFFLRLMRLLLRLLLLCWVDIKIIMAFESLWVSDSPGSLNFEGACNEAIIVRLQD